MTSTGCPPKFARALHHAVFPAGNRLRPSLCLGVASALGDRNPRVTDAAAAALELMHTASLVHDDLPAFDDSPMRRGRPSVHAAFGEALAVLVGDALMIGAFETLALAGGESLGPLSRVLARAAGTPHGMCSGQAWESEAEVELARYHRAKTAGMFEAATMAGALCAGHDGEPWRALGRHVGEAYQVADDIRDLLGGSDLGKPLGRDEAKGRPSAVRAFGLEEARRLLANHAERAAQSIPPCEGRDALAERIGAMLRSFT
jgi:geranylgeranyl diphosphate synthase type II